MCTCMDYEIFQLSTGKLLVALVINTRFQYSFKFELQLNADLWCVVFGSKMFEPSKKDKMYQHSIVQSWHHFWLDLHQTSVQVISSIFAWICIHGPKKLLNLEYCSWTEGAPKGKHQGTCTRNGRWSQIILAFPTHRVVYLFRGQAPLSNKCSNETFKCQCIFPVVLNPESYIEFPPPLIERSQSSTSRCRLTFVKDWTCTEP